MAGGSQTVAGMPPAAEVGLRNRLCGLSGSGSGKAKGGSVWQREKRRNSGTDDRKNAPIGSLRIKIQCELIRMRSQPHRVRFPLPLVPCPRLDHVLGEHVPLQ